MDILQFLGLDDVDLAQQLVNVIWLGSVYSLFALGYALIFSVLGVLNLSHSAVFMWGAFIGLTTTCGDVVFEGRCVTLERPFWAGIPTAMIGGGILAILIDRVAFYPLRKRNAPRLSQLISSIGVAIVLVNLAQLRFSAENKLYPTNEVPNTPIGIPINLDTASPIDLSRLIASFIIHDLEISISEVQIVVIIVALLLMVILSYIVTQTRLGQGMRTVAFSSRVGSLMGVNADNMYIVAFFISGALAGASGVLYSLAVRAVNPFIGELFALKGLTVIVLGGLGSIRGAVLGGFIVALIEVYVKSATPYGDLSDGFVFFLFLLILLIRPQGILGQPIEDRA